MEVKEESIIDSHSVTAGAFRHVSSLHKENLDAIFTNEKLEKLDNLVTKINNVTINNSGYELITAAVSDAQGNLASDLYTVTHISNGILDQKPLS